MLYKAFNQAYDVLGNEKASTFNDVIYDKEIEYSNGKRLYFVSQNVLSSPNVVGKYNCVDNKYTILYSVVFDQYLFYVDIYGRTDMSCAFSQTQKQLINYGAVLINYLNDKDNQYNSNERLILDAEVMALRDVYESVLFIINYLCIG